MLKVTIYFHRRTDALVEVVHDRVTENGWSNGFYWVRIAGAITFRYNSSDIARIVEEPGA